MQGNFAESHRYYSEALEVAQKIAQTEEGNHLFIAIHRGLGKLYEKENLLRKAIGEFRRAATYIEQSRSTLQVEQFRIGFFSDYSEVYQRLAECYYQLYQQKAQPGYVDSIAYFMEMSRGRSLKDMSFRKSRIWRTGENPTYRKYRATSQQLRAYQRILRTGNFQQLPGAQRDSILNRIEILRYALLEYRVRLLEEDWQEGASETGHPQSVTDIQKELRKMDAGLLQFHIGEKFSFVLVTDKKGVTVIPLSIINEELENSVSELMTPFHQLNQLNLSTTPFRADIAYDLYRKLILPIESQVSLPHNLLIEPDLAMTNLPLEILLTAPPQQPIYTPIEDPVYAKDFLQHRYIFTYSPTAILIHPRRFRIGEPAMLVFANPFGADEVLAKTGPLATPNNRSSETVRKRNELREGISIDRRFTPLAFAEVEAAKIRDIFPSASVFLREKFTKARFIELVPQFNIIHVATHGFVETSFDAFSGLVLAPDENPQDDGFLMGYEISDIDLQKCDLIALSACETGQGELIAGEGVLGLPRLFLGAGAKSVLMTLWKVDDQFTSELMPEFYENLLSKHLSKAEALAVAKRKVLNARSRNDHLSVQHPVFWGSFVLFGDPGSKPIYISGTVLFIGIGFTVIFLGGISIIFIRLYRKRR